MTITLTNDERAKVRKVITSHPDWHAYRTARAITAADLTSARCVEACNSLGIDVETAKAGEATGEASDLFDATTTTTTETTHMTAAAPADAITALETLRALLGNSVSPEQVRHLVDDAMRPHLERLGQPILRVVDRDGQAWGKDLPAVRHHRLDDLLTAVTARDVSNRPLNVWLSGPSQSGKTTAAEQCAKALGLEFGFHGAMEMAHDLVGFVDGAGRYHETVFVRLYRQGGFILLDEVDGWSPEVTLVLNAALANGHMSLPTGEIVTRHQSTVIVAAANTWGHGGTTDYVGRAKLDGAFLQRFPVKLDWPYDEKMERDMSGNADFARRVQRARKAALKAGLKVLITPAHSKAGAALIAAGVNEDTAAKWTYLADLSPEQRQIVDAA